MMPANVCAMCAFIRPGLSMAEHAVPMHLVDVPPVNREPGYQPRHDCGSVFGYVHEGSEQLYLDVRRPSRSRHVGVTICPGRQDQELFLLSGVQL
jgi:hypothetical protein